ncbi:diaminopropionate ammonia-lyase [Cryptosporangium sp. NPDC051539]|uniref:diaminopropionate ammonia-lyase n=1 Tax=Cryptosporangium sp. NPDC051539 TaxID=3363962 RepID=UPI0037919A8E
MSLPALTPRIAIVNPHTDPTRIRSSSGPAVRAFHETLPGYRPSPLVDAPALAAKVGVASLSVKDESSRLDMPSFKVLGASWATFRALSALVGPGIGSLPELAGRLVDRNLTLVAATDGNHGRAVARMARLLHVGAHILVPRDMVAARIEAIRAEGADVTVVDGNYDVAVAASAALADETHLVISDTSWPGYEQVPAWVIDGYSTIVEEVLAELGTSGRQRPTVVVAQMGVGAFASAMIRGFVPTGARLIGAEPTRAACVLESIRAGQPVQLDGNLDSIMAGLNCGTPSPLAWPDLLAGLDRVAAVDDDDAEQAMRDLASIGVVSGESGAAGYAALLAHAAELGLTPDDHVLVISTEGATDPVAYQRIVSYRKDSHV